MLAVVGATLTDVTVPVAACTVKDAEPLTPLTDAVMVVTPTAADVARPVVLTDAIDPAATLHVAVELTFAVEPSL
jgi:hypothetical protein